MHPNEYAALRKASLPNPDDQVTRDAGAAALTAAGYPTATVTLATKACRGGGPPYRIYSGRALYRWSDLLAWAEARTSAPRRSTSEAGTPAVAPQGSAAVPSNAAVAA